MSLIQIIFATIVIGAAMYVTSKRNQYENFPWLWATLFTFALFILTYVFRKIY